MDDNVTIDSKTDEQSTPEVEASADDTVVAAAPVTPESDTEADEPEGDAEDYLVEEGEIAGDYLEQLLDVLDFDGDIDLDVEGDRAVVSIDGGKDLNKLVGRKGEVLDALQELTRLAVQQSTGDRSKLMLDVAGWRAGRREELTRLGTEAAERVAASGDSEPLEPMTPFERKIVHDAVATIAGVTSESDGVEPNRHVVVVKE
ncbi:MULTISPECIES: Jag family protein [unclassified Rhodococcus (in: high G+C Gram-positive bacteria)]|jgi:spoIIIJ-associated protein|uniref:Jag family protein n=1 Tax=unclassified Rhodococcus (in: high G+C Gram-positive bacteria) TaxID=192944 RepID=UPI0009DC9444|nr:protein jag [Rhodococcus sp. BP-332]MBY6687924.1 protein jag [Rhodococcus sp. BP-288]MBY6696377.1 protein jag [Rhodococcus sp. BP-188]MBY6700854.1 protein jag [Rhodococcus sp. BP-285]MBY6701621.1 protein jag [Rhodococcus sp. BP-283]MBY6712622.1 protein jag [Rhodococcus sp. BP-160]MBY6717357.1 protein jag [Rhodococcus sp. BP-110]MBY6719870.1 protein jag [Rhodococcus sp. BP-142]MBY6723151.1 protein jag [Rhodococcus sp. BP-149]MBY6729468.1 protein jag [Rhodococcus sp. BP-107]MDQ1182541.1 